MQLREFAFERREKIGVVLEGKFGVQPADDVQLGRTFGDGVAGDLDAFVHGMRVRTFLPGTLVESAELTVGDADVRVVEMPVDVVIRRQAVLAAADGVGQLAESGSGRRSCKATRLRQRSAARRFLLFPQGNSGSGQRKIP